MTVEEAPDQLNGQALLPAQRFLGMTAIFGVIALTLGAVVLFVFPFRAGFGLLEVVSGVARAEWPIPAVMPAIGTVLSGVMTWLQTRDLRFWVKQVAPPLVAGYATATGAWMLLVLFFTGAG